MLARDLHAFDAVEQFRCGACGAIERVATPVGRVQIDLVAFEQMAAVLVVQNRLAAL